MKALVLVDKATVTVEERAVPRPGQGEVQIRIQNVSLCGSDLEAFRHPSDRFKPPIVLGHEFSGDITAIGAGASLFQPGDRVTVNPIIACRQCDFCKRGEYNHCGSRRNLGTSIGGITTDGGMAEYICVPEWMAIPLPENLSYASGAMLEPTAVALSCAKRGWTKEERSCVILGAGPIGLLTLKCLRALGVEQIIVSDILQTRLDKAMELGAAAVVNSKREDPIAFVKAHTNGYGADRVINAAGEFLINDAFEMVRNAGTTVLVALAHTRVEIDPMQLVGRDTAFLGSYMYTNEIAEAAKLVAEGKLFVEDLITATFPLEEGQLAFDMLAAPDNAEVKVQLLMC